MDSGFRRNDEQFQWRRRNGFLAYTYLASGWDGTFYVGVTSDLTKRVWEHKTDCVEGFSKKYSTHVLVWFELHETMESAILREKAIKEWRRAWKIESIEKANPYWHDLYADLL